MTVIDLTPEEFRCAMSMSCPRVLARAACIPGSCPAVLEGKADALIIIGKQVEAPIATLNDYLNPEPYQELVGMIGEGEAAIEIDRALVVQAIEPVLLTRIAELEMALKPFAQWAGDLDKEFADHGNDIIVGGRSDPFPTFGHLRAARAALVKLDEGAA